MWEQSDLLIVLNYAALSFAVVVTWGTECIPRRLPGLGLRPLGAVAFMGLWMLLVWLVPVAVTGLPDAVGLVIGLLMLGGGLGTFVFSRWGLHRQMVGVKEDELALARALYAEAYEPVRAARTLEAVEHQRPLLGAADTLEKLARAIHDWPVAEGTVGLGDRDRDERRRNRVRPTGPPSVGLLTRSRLPC